MAKKYGWRIPILDLKDPDYCEYGCPVCRRARTGNRVAKALQVVEMKLLPSGCPWGKARERKYGVKPDEPVPEDWHERNE